MNGLRFDPSDFTPILGWSHLHHFDGVEKSSFIILLLCSESSPQTRGSESSFKMYWCTEDHDLTGVTLIYALSNSGQASPSIFVELFLFVLFFMHTWKWYCWLLLSDKSPAQFSKCFVTLFWENVCEKPPFISCGVSMALQLHFHQIERKTNT